MGTAALFFTVGISTNTFNMFKVAIACATLAVVLATPEADPHYYGLAAPVLYNAYPNWPGVSTPYSSSTCFGCRGKRSAEAEPMLMPTTDTDTTPTTVPSTILVFLATPDLLPLSRPDLPKDLARGLLMLKPMLRLTTVTTDTVTVTVTVDTEVTTDIPMDIDTTGKWRELFC